MQKNCKNYVPLTYLHGVIIILRSTSIYECMGPIELINSMHECCIDDFWRFYLATNLDRSGSFMNGTCILFCASLAVVGCHLYIHQKSFQWTHTRSREIGHHMDGSCHYCNNTLLFVEYCSYPTFYSFPSIS